MIASRRTRNWRSLSAGAVVVFAVVGLFVAAFLADARAASESETNDGGAWMANRQEGAIGHVNRAVEEYSSTVVDFVGEFNVDQSRDVVLVSDPSTEQVSLIAPARSSVLTSVAVGPDVEAVAAPSAVVFMDEASGRVWRVATADLESLGELAEQGPSIRAEGPVRVAVSLLGEVVAADPTAGDVLWLPVDEPVEPIDAPALEGATVMAVTVVGDRAVTLTEDNALVVSRAGGGSKAFELEVEPVVLQQPGPAADRVVAITADGVVLEIDLESGEATEVRRLGGSAPLAPIVHNGCTHVVTIEPTPTYHFCDRTEPLVGAGTALRLRLVNDWVWVNDVENGFVWLVDRDVELKFLDAADWQAALPQDDSSDEGESDAGGSDEQVADEEADDVAEEIDQLDDDQENTDPVAADDTARTRRTRPILVDVLANDTDEDRDQLTVSGLGGLDGRGLTPQGIAISITADGKAVQVTPNGDFVGDTTFEYTVSDGRVGSDGVPGTDTAQVRVTIVPDDQQSPPEPVLDSGLVRAGRSVSMNVLLNDSDPDGDPLILLDVREENGEAVGAIAFAPDGEVTFTPDVTLPAGQINLLYDVSDDREGRATGRIQIEVRPADSNLAPLARSDLGRTVVGGSVQIDVLANDGDADGDPLTAVGLTAVEPQGVVAQLTPQGEFLFVPAEPGIYRFTYGASDGRLVSLPAQIRIDVEDPPANRPPVAVVDEVALAVGETRLIRVLENDGDPDGDVVGIVNYTEPEGLTVDEVPGVGFRVTALDNADARVQFLYWISDGQAEPVATSVIVSTVRSDRADYRPVARPDVFSVRAGRTSLLPVLLNDYDPEGGVLTIVSVEEIPDGVLRVAPDGQAVLLTVPEDQASGLRFTYEVTDDGGSGASAVVRVDIVSPGEPNRPPVAAPDVVRTIEGRAVTISVTDNDSDPETDGISVQGPDSQPLNGTVTRADDGTLLYTPRPGFTGTDRFTYTLVDDYDGPGGPAASIGQVSVGVMPIEANRRPVADDDLLGVVAIGTEGPVVLPVLANDDDPDDDPIAVVGFSELPAGAGTLSEATGGSAILYTPPAEAEPQQVTFSYRIADPGGLQDTARVTFDLVDSADADPPVAVDDVIPDVAANTEVTFDPRANDINNAGPLEDLRVAPSIDGSYALAPGGTAIVVPPLTESTEILYRVVDAGGRQSDPAVIRVDVRENRAPVVSLPAFSTPEDEPLTVEVHRYVDDPDGDPLALRVGNQRRSGGVEPSVGEGTLVVVFTPDEGSGGSIGGFNVLVDDGVNPVQDVFVEITIERSENTPPVATDAERTGEAGVDIVVWLPGLVEDDDLDSGDRHEFSIEEQSGPIRADRRGDTVTFRSELSDGGATESFRYTVTDSDGASDSATISIELTTPDHPAPDVLDAEAESLRGESVTISVLEGAVSNVPGDPTLRVVDVEQPASGRTTTDGRTVTFTPAASFDGRAEFRFFVQDGRNQAEYQTIARAFVDVIREPGTPQPPTIAGVGEGEISLTWSPPADSRGADILQYRITYETDAGGRGSHDTTGPQTSYTWRGLTNGEAHRFTVAARNDAGWGEPSALSLPETPDTAPERPGPPRVVDWGDGWLEIDWPAADSRGTDVSRYLIDMRCGTRPGNYETLGTQTELRVTGLRNGDPCSFVVTAENDAGPSLPSEPSQPEYPSTVPTAPSAPVGERGDGQVPLTWAALPNTPEATGGDSVDYYQWRTRVNGGAPAGWSGNIPASGQQLSAVARELTNGDRVEFQVRAANRDGQGPPSSWSAPVTPCGAPDAPTNIRADFGNRQVEISWRPPVDLGGCVITNYRVSAGGRTWTAGPGATSRIADGLDNGTEYTFTVQAQNEIDWSPPSASVTEIPAGPPIRPGVPPDCRNSADGQVMCEWAPFDGNGRPVLQYSLLANNLPVYVGSGIEATATGLSRGTNYSFRVVATNEIGATSGPSRGMGTWDVPGIPAITVSGVTGQVRASWLGPTPGNIETPPFFTAHEAQLVTGPCGSGVSRLNAGSPEVWDAQSGQTYSVCVRYQNILGWGLWGRSNSVVVQEPLPPPPTWNSFDATVEDHPNQPGYLIQMFGSIGLASGQEPIRCQYIVSGIGGGSVTQPCSPTPSYQWYLPNPGTYGFQIRVCDRHDQCVDSRQVIRTL